MEALKKYTTGFIHAAVIVVAIFASYSNSFDSYFQLDDNHVVLNNDEIKDPANFLEPARWKRVIFNRAFAYFTVSVNYAIHGYDLFGYHLFNIIVHIITSLLVYYFVIILFRSKVLSIHRIFTFRKELAFITALIFAVHPVQIQVVTYITQRMASLATLFYLLSVILYIHGRYKHENSGQIKQSIIFYALALLSFIIGQYSKAIIMSLPITLLLVEFTFIRKKNGAKNLKFCIGWLIFIVIMAGYIFLVRGFPQQKGAIENPGYFLTQLNVLVTYLRIMFVPVNLHLIYQYPVAQSLLEFPTLINFFIIVSLVITGIIINKKFPLISLAVLWFFVTQSIESSVFPLQYVIFEYRLYPSMLSYGLLLSVLVFSYIKIEKTYLTAFFICLSFVYASTTYSLNEKWADGISLWKDNVEKAPNHPVPRNHLGTYLYMNGQVNDAIESYTKSIELDSNYAQPYNHRGVIYKERGEYGKALADFYKAIEKDTLDPMICNNMGYAYQGLGQYDSAIYYFRKAILKSKNYHTAINNLAIAYYSKGEYKRALEIVDIALSIEPSIAKYNNNKGNILFAMERYEDAKSAFQQAVKNDPDYEKAVNNLGMCYLREGELDIALKHFNKAILIDPKYADPYLNRALVMYQKNNYSEAYKQVIKCLELEPSHQKALGFKQLIEKILVRQ